MAYETHKNVALTFSAIAEKKSTSVSFFKQKLELELFVIWLKVVFCGQDPVLIAIQIYVWLMTLRSG